MTVAGPETLMQHIDTLCEPTSDLSKYERKQIKFRDVSDDSQIHEGTLVEILPRSDSSDNTCDRVLRVLHTDGMVRKWLESEIRLICSLHKQDAFSKEEVSLQLQLQHQLLNADNVLANSKDAIGKQIEVWNEDSRQWEKAKVASIDVESQRPIVKFGGAKRKSKPEELIDRSRIWRYSDHKLKITPKDHEARLSDERLLWEEPNSGLSVTLLTDRCTKLEKVVLYKKLLIPSWPRVKLTQTRVTIQESQDEEDDLMVHTCVIELPREADIDSPIDAVVDHNGWLQLVYKPLELMT